MNHVEDWELANEFMATFDAILDLCGIASQKARIGSGWRIRVPGGTHTITYWQECQGGPMFVWSMMVDIRP